MFGGLMQGSILYGVDIKNGMKYFTAPINKVTIGRQNISVNIGQYPENVVDISATVDGEPREFKQVPGNSSIADFGGDTLILADSRESLATYIQSKRQERIKRIESIDVDKQMVAKYDKVLKEINPAYTNEKEVKALNDRIGSLESQLAEAIALIKANNKVN